jgi:exosortase H (IPTLxxWG-CTERM-specific)
MAGQRGDQGEKPKGWRAYRQEIVFLVAFVLLLGGSFTLISLNWVNDHVIEPFTAGIAHASGAALEALGQDIHMRGTMILSDRFSVNIRNGCNGVEAMLIFFSAVLAFPATWGSRLAGLGIGLVAIQVINLVRVVALYLTGAYLPRFFDASHTVVWQTIVILFGVLLWIFWANRFAVRQAA